MKLLNGAIISGPFQFQDGNQGAGKFLGGDANGNISWQVAMTEATGDARYARRDNNLSDLASPSAARSNLGLFSMATKIAGTAGHEFRSNAENDARFSLVSHSHNNMVPDIIHPRPAFREGFYFTNILHTWVGAFTTRSISANRIMLHPVVVYADTNLKIDEIGINVSTAASSGIFSADILIFSSLNGFPNQLLREIRITGLDTTGYKGAAVDFTFSKGVLYWVGMVSGCACTITALSNSASMNMGLTAANSTSQWYGLWRSFTFNDRYPTKWIWSDSEISSASAISFRFRVASELSVPATPTNVMAFSGMTPGTVDVYWDAVPGADSYPLQWRVNDGSINQEWPDPTSTTHSLSGFQSMDWVEVRVAAKNAAGTSAYSSWAGTYVEDAYVEDGEV